MILDGDVHMAALDDPRQVRSLKLTKSKRSDWAQSYHHEVTQRVQAGADQTRFPQCKLWIQFGMSMWVEDENVGYAYLEVSTAEEASQNAHAEVADEDLGDPEDYDTDAVLPEFYLRSPQMSTQVRVFQAVDADEDESQRSQTQKPKKPKTKAAAEPKQTTLTQPQGLRRTLSLLDPGTAVRSTLRSKMFAGGLKNNRKPST